MTGWAQRCFWRLWGAGAHVGTSAPRAGRLRSEQQVRPEGLCLILEGGRGGSTAGSQSRTGALGERREKDPAGAWTSPRGLLAMSVPTAGPQVHLGRWPCSQWSGNPWDRRETCLQCGCPEADPRPSW